ncbi:O-antigen ligase family protein [Pyxidicoccus trucidator]|uniref:O-antigen ligase family protein n=1 Tax=Pyxidicoccus trucidator TaxID=2709662 RepID=UPI0013DC5C1E|nr:O-antigen ligase family protein [Pyxidicoccus trucidator]
MRRLAWAAPVLLVAGVFGSVFAMWPVPPVDPLDFFQPKAAVLILVAFVTAALVVAREPECRLDLEAGGLLLFLALGVLSVLTVAVNRSLAWSSMGVSAGGVLAFLVARTLPARSRQSVLTAVVATLLLAALVATLEAFRLTFRLSTPHRIPGGPLGNRNALSHLLVLGLPATALLALGERRWGRVLAFAAALASGYVLVLARSRGAWLGGGLAVVLLTGVVGSATRRAGRGSPWRRGAVVLVALMLGGAAALVLPNRLNWRSPHPYRDTLATLVEADTGSGHGRMVQYERSLLMAREYWPLGTGPGNWSVHYPRFAAPDDPSVHRGSFEPTNRHPSSDWIAVLSERGFMACALLALVALRVLLLTGRALLRAPTREDALAGGTAAATFLALAWLGAIDAVLVTPGAACVAAVLLGVLLPRQPDDTWHVAVLTASTPRALRGGVAVTLCALGALGAAREVARLVLRESARTTPHLEAVEERVSRFAADDYPSRMTLALRWTVKGSCDRAAPHLAAATQLLPEAAAPGQLALRCRSRQGEEPAPPQPGAPGGSPSSQAKPHMLRPARAGQQRRPSPGRWR